MISTAPSGSRDVTSDSASAERYTSVSPYDATRTTAFWFGSSLGVPASAGPQDIRARACRRERSFLLGRPRTRTWRCSRGRMGGLLALGPVAARLRLENLSRREACPDHLRRTAHVITLRVGQDDRGERVDAHARELPRDVGLGWAFVDEDAGARRLEQGRVALPDVEEGDAQPAAGPRQAPAALIPTTAVARRRHASARATPTRRRRTVRRRSPRRRARATADAGEPRARSARRRSGGRQSGRDVRQRAPARRPPSRRAPRGRPRSEGETGSTTAASSPRPRTSGAAANASTFAGDGVERDLAEVEQEDRCCREPACAGDGEHVRDPAGTG